MTAKSTRNAFAQKRPIDVRRQHFQAVVGDKIRAERHKADKSLAAVALETGLSMSTVESAEEGLGVSAFALALIAEALDVSLDELVPTEATDEIGRRDVG